jgi:hypothetical protein
MLTRPHTHWQLYNAVLVLLPDVEHVARHWLHQCMPSQHTLLVAAAGDEFNLPALPRHCCSRRLCRGGAGQQGLEGGAGGQAGGASASLCLRARQVP